ncbi:MAG TPA: mechanosensitive ion channel domain-containing protein [Terracidiphilus sp.]|nr:mechanosensitive ion channel domain-containing protein [Terracidiphilus sp.]
MKLKLRIAIVVVFSAAIALAWNGSHATSGPLADVARAVGHVLNITFFMIGNLPVTPMFLMKATVFLTLLSLGSHLTRKIMRDRVLGRTSLDEGLQYALSVTSGYVVFFVGATVGLQSLGLDLSSMAFLGGAVGLGIGVGLQGVVNNFVSGLILLAERPIKVGDRVEIENLTGDVIQIAARSTWVRTNDNVVIIVPNSEFTGKRVTNWTANDRCVRIKLDVGTSYSSDPEKVKKILLQVARAHPDVLVDPEPDVIFCDFGDSSLDFELRVWTMNQVRTPQILRSDLYFAIFKVFSKEGIEIPFPQRDLHLRSISMPIALTREAGHATRAESAE